MVWLVVLSAVIITLIIIQSIMGIRRYRRHKRSTCNDSFSAGSLSTCANGGYADNINPEYSLFKSGITRNDSHVSVGNIALA